MKIEVLDYGHVEYIDHMGDDLSVVNSARVSFNKQSDWEDERDSIDQTPTGDRILSNKDKKLIGYLAKNDHWTPFAHTSITLRIKAPSFVRAQLGKHQVGCVMNEVSRRYVTDTPKFYTPRWRSAPTDGAKQGSSDFMANNQYATQLFQNLCDDALDGYQELLKEGIAPEQARSILPQSMYTEWWWTGSLVGFARVFHQRIDAHAQWEVQQYAKAISEIVKPIFPESWKALVEIAK
jgi:thymidylate synthase (FAD)